MIDRPEDRIHGRSQLETMSEDGQKTNITTHLEDRMSQVYPCICYTYFHRSALALHQGGFSQAHGETNTE
jgi:hypothetical protein